MIQASGLRGSLTGEGHDHAAERLEALLDLLNAIEEIIPATPGSRASVEHQLHRLMADMVAHRNAKKSRGLHSLFYH